jgi:ElaB/YqjD/DUF883 family membrane-anchored ribosome-binding protein
MTPSVSSTDQLNPDAGFTTTPSVSQAANDLRLAAGEKAKEFIHTAEASANQFKDRAVESAQQFRQTATIKAAQLKTAATEQAAHLKENATEQWNQTRVKAKEMHGTAEDYIRENPTKCVLSALGVGFLLGLILRR